MFYSPFEVHPGFRDGDPGTLMRIDLKNYRPDTAIRDLWIARNDRDGKEYEVWGGECFTPKGRAIVRPHRFRNWKPTLLVPSPIELLARVPVETKEKLRS